MVLSLLGFSACEKFGTGGTVEYGTSHADFVVSGKITDSNGNGLTGIEDVSENPRFENDSTKVTFFSSEWKGGDKRWYSGSTMKEITVRLKEK